MARSNPPRKHEGETLSEYFSPERGEQIVRRYELLAILTQFHKAERENRWWRRLIHWIKDYYRKSALAPVSEELKK